MRRVMAAAMVATVLLAATGCLTLLRSQQPLTPVPTPASPLAGVYEPGALGSWSNITAFNADGLSDSEGPDCHALRNRHAHSRLSERHPGDHFGEADLIRRLASAGYFRLTPDPA